MVTLPRHFAAKPSASRTPFRKDFRKNDGIRRQPYRAESDAVCRRRTQITLRIQGILRLARALLATPSPRLRALTLIPSKPAQYLIHDVERAAQAGVDARVDIWRGMLHVFPSSVGRLQASTQALDAVGSFLAERLFQ